MWFHTVYSSVMGLYLGLVFTANHNQLPVEENPNREVNWVEMNVWSCALRATVKEPPRQSDHHVPNINVLELCHFLIMGYNL